MECNKYHVLTVTVALVGLWFLPGCESQTAVCGTVAGGLAEATDLIFVVDSSAGMGQADFDTTKQFLNDLTPYFRITFSQINGVRAAGMVFDGTTANIQFTFQISIRKVQTECLAMPYLGGAGSDLAGAINTLTSSTIASDRGTVQNVALIITNGPSLSSANAIAAALSAYNSGTDIITIGVTNGVDANEIMQVASPPRVANQNYHFVNTFADLLSATFMETVARGVCARKTPAPTTPAPPPTTTVPTTTTTTPTTTTPTTTPTTTTTTPATTTTTHATTTTTPATTTTTPATTTTMPGSVTVPTTAAPGTGDSLILGLAVGIPLALLFLLLLLLLLCCCCRESCAGCCAGCCETEVESQCGPVFCCAGCAGCVTSSCSACFWTEEKEFSEVKPEEAGLMELVSDLPTPIVSQS